MDPRNSTRMSNNRRPLGDATQRVNNTTGNVNFQRRNDGEEKISVPKFRADIRGRSNPVASTRPAASAHPGTRTPATAMAPEDIPVNPRPAPVVQDPREVESNRVSQFSVASSLSSSGQHRKTQIGPWRLGKTLGKGSQARVRLAEHSVTRELAAIKIVTKTTAHLTQAGSLANLDSVERRKRTNNTEDDGLRLMPLAIEREVAILKLIQHPNIIKLLDIWENKSEIYLVTEFIDKGDMFEFINWKGCFPEVETMFYFRQIMSALDWCHSFNICHRDLKPENILINGLGQIKIADFGMAALQQNSNHQLRTACGSPHYAAPELLKHQPYKGSAVDIWSMGVILFAMLVGRLPFDDDDINVMLSKAKRALYTMPRNLSHDAEDLVRKILVAEPRDRITMSQMWRHALLKQYEYLEEHMTWEGPPRDVFSTADMGPIPESEIDIQLLRQLKALWHSYTEAELRKKLGQEKANDQKLFYWLLYKHREAQLENYNNDVAISKSDFHHLKPPTWGKRIATCEFTKPGPDGYPESVSKFTVISNVAEQDEVVTVKSYDPYNSSQVLLPCGSQVSHAKIVVHRNNPEYGLRSAPTNVSHSHHSTHRSANVSFQQHSRMSSQRTNTTGHLRSPHGSMSSIRSHQSTPRKVRVNPRTKRGVDFSHVRAKDTRRLETRDTASDSGSHGRRTGSPLRCQKSKMQGALHPQQLVTTTKNDDHILNPELHEQLKIYCDEAFNTSLPLAEPNSSTERRAVSEPVYNHSGKESRPLPSIYENVSEEGIGENLVRHRVMTDPLRPHTSTGNKGLDYLARVDNTIRVVNSPAIAEALDRAQMMPAPLNIRKKSGGTSKTPEPASAISSHADTRRQSGGMNHNGHDFDGQATGSNVVERKRVTSWFKRSSKDGETDSSFVTVAEDSPRLDETNLKAHTERKRKGFTFSFWKGTMKDTPEMSLADSDDEDMFDHEQEEQAQRSKAVRNERGNPVNSAARAMFENESTGARKIEPHQNWLARLFRFKPVNRYLCFSLRKQRARQEIVLLLKSWRRFGITGIEVDKERNVIFGRLDAKNTPKIREVSFAIEIMKVIEHGNRNPLSIARFTQEKGAASSFNKIVDEMSSQFTRKSLLITDKRKVDMMVKTLNT